MNFCKGIWKLSYAETVGFFLHFRLSNQLFINKYTKLDTNARANTRKSHFNGVLFFDSCQNVYFLSHEGVSPVPVCPCIILLNCLVKLFTIFAKLNFVSAILFKNVFQTK